MRQSFVVWFILFYLSIFYFMTGPVFSQDGPGVVGVRLIYPEEYPYTGYFRYNLAQGKSRSGEFEVYNRVSRPVRVKVYSSDVFCSPDGTLSGIILGEEPTSTGTWVEVEDTDLTLAPGEKKLCSFNYSVPHDAAPGDYFSFIFVEPVERETQRIIDTSSHGTKSTVNMVVVQRIGIIIWNRVPGEHIIKLDYSNLEKKIEAGFLQLSFTIFNKGNLFLKPEIKWRIADDTDRVILGQEVEMYGYLMPGCNNHITIPIISERPLPKGTYRLIVDLSDEQSSHKETKEFPIKLP